MKRSIIFFLTALISLTAYSQRREINNAEDANDEGNYEKSRSILKSVESKISDERESRQADFYLAKGYAFLGNKGKGQSAEDFKVAGESFKKAAQLGEEDEANQALEQLRVALINSASKDQKSKNFSASTEKLHTGYQLNKNDTITLYYAASSALNAQDYDTALEYYKELNDIGYSGSKLVYTAKNTESGKIEQFQNKDKRDTYLKSDQYTDGGVKNTESKQAEITKMIALIYNQKGKNQKAKQAIQTAQKNNPNDIELKLVSAEVQKKLGNEEKYKEILQEVAKKNPENEQIQYRLGISAMEAGERKKAMKYFKNTVKIEPKLRGAYVNMAVTTLNQEKELLDQMNDLGMSDEDNAKYDKLQEKRNQVFKDAIPYLTKAIKLDPEKSAQEIKQLKNLYQQLGEDEKAEKIDEKYN